MPEKSVLVLVSNGILPTVHRGNMQCVAIATLSDIFNQEIITGKEKSALGLWRAVSFDRLHAKRGTLNVVR